MASRITNEFYGFIKSRKRSICVIGSILKDTSFKAVKRDTKFETRYVKGVPNVNRIEGIRKGHRFREKWYIKG